MLILEDGTGLLTSNAYIDVAELDAYAALRAIDLTAYDTAAKEAAIITTTIDFVDVNYCFKGEVLDADQSLLLPTDLVSVNKDVKNAVANGSVLQLKSLLFIAAENISEKGDIKSEMKKLSVLETETEYTEGTASISARHATINKLLSKYLCYGGGVMLIKT